MNLTCEARGYPQPQIMWRREDGRSITANGHTKKGITNKYHNIVSQKMYHRKVAKNITANGHTKKNFNSTKYYKYYQILQQTFTPKKGFKTFRKVFKINYGRSITANGHTKKGITEKYSQRPHQERFRLIWPTSSWFLLAFVSIWPMYSAAI